MIRIEVKWIKLCVDLFQNPKIIQLRSLKGGDKYILIWIMLLVLAGRSNRSGRLMLTDNIPYDIKMLSRELGFSAKTLELVFQEFVRLNMIKLEEGVYSLRNWEKYQNAEALDLIREKERLKKQKQRAKARGTLSRDILGTVPGCPHTEEEEDKDSEKELEFHSFCQAQHSEFVENKKRSFMQGSLGAGVVMLSNEQLDDLLDRLSLEEFDRYVGIVRDQELAGKHYRKRTHYQAILDMAEKDRAVR